jgi:hypothetical protein
LSVVAEAEFVPVAGIHKKESISTDLFSRRGAEFAEKSKKCSGVKAILENF